MREFEIPEHNPNDPKLYPELAFNTELPFEAKIAESNQEVLDSLVPIMPYELQEKRIALGHSLLALTWAVNGMGYGYNKLLIITPGEKIAAMVNSPIINNTITPKITEDWIKEQEKRLLEQASDYTSYPFKYNIASVVDEVAQKTRIDSYQVLSNHSIVVFSQISRNINNGNLVSAYSDNDRSFVFFPDEIYPSPLTEEDKMLAIRQTRIIRTLPELSVF